MALEQRSFFRNYDILSTSYVFGRLLPRAQGDGAAKTVGSSITVNSVATGRGLFAPLAVGDFLQFYLSDTNILKRKVASIVSPEQITVDTAIDLSAGLGVPWYYEKFQSGGTATDGWIPCQKYKEKTIQGVFPTIADAGGFTLRIDIKGFDIENQPEVILERPYPQTPANLSDAYVVPERAAAVRVGLKGTSGFAGTDDMSFILVGGPEKP